MKNRKKWMFVLPFMALLAGCQNSGTGDVTNQTLPTDDPTSEKEIVFWHCMGHAKSSQVDVIAEKFNQEYKGKYHVTTKKLAGDYKALADAIKTKISAGETPALSMGYPDNFAAYMSKDISQSAIYQLDHFIHDPNYGFSQDEINDFVPEFWKEGSSYHFEGTWSMPMYKSTEIMYYNAAYMAGLNEQNNKKFQDNDDYWAVAQPVVNAAAEATDEQLTALRTWVKANNGYAYDVPTKWDEMFATAAKMQQDRAAEGVNAEFYPVGYDSDANMLISQFAQRGIAYTTNDNINTSEDHFKFVNPEAKAFVTDVVNKVRDGLLITKGTLGGSKYTNEYFTASKCAMTIGSTGGSSYNVSANFPVRLAPVPYSGDTPKYIQQGPSIAFFNNGDPYIHKGAWLFYKYLSDPVNNATLALENSYDPVRNSSFQTKAYEEWISKHAMDLKYDIPYHTKDLRQYYMLSPVFVGSDEARSQMELLIGNVVNSKMTVDDAFNTAMNACVAAA
ncbi:MAG: hypothetical protein PUC66_06800 [Erysipelotrichaceae bacterium]|nr:hypothetical protein [Erysipelotrichaceae bacterium]